VGHEIVTNMASGLNWQCKGLRSLLDDCFNGLVQEVAILHWDRLACFGVKLLEYIFKKNNVQLMVVGEGNAVDIQMHQALEAVINLSQKLTNDLITITSFFMVQHNGLCSVAH